MGAILGFFASVIMFVFGLLFILVVIGVMVLRGKLKFMSQRSTANTQRERQRQRPGTWTSTDDERNERETVKPHPGKKIFSSEDGEYVDFEEIRE